MTKPYIQRIRPHPLCQPTLTYSKEGITFRVTPTSDILMETILWSVNSTDAGFINEKWEDFPNSGEYTESTGLYVADSDEMFVK